MSDSSESMPTGPLSPASSHCDVCSVTRDADRVFIHFGEQVRSVLDPRITSAALRHRVGLDEATASKLQDLMAGLLAEGGQPQ